MSIVLEGVLKRPRDLRLARQYKDDPLGLWAASHKHQTNSVTLVRITIKLSQELVKMKVSQFSTITKCLETFDSKLENFNELSSDNMTVSLVIESLKTATSGNDQLLHAWALCDTIKETTNTGVAPTYKEYQNFLMSAAEKLEDSIIDNSSSQKVNVGETDFLQPYTPALIYIFSLINASR